MYKFILTFILSLIFTVNSFSQVSIRSTLDSQYFTKITGDTISNHNTLHKAIQAKLQQLYPELNISIISSFGSPFYAMAGEDTISQHNRIDQAIEAAVNSGYPNTKVVRELQLRINDADHTVEQSLELDIFVDDEPIIIIEEVPGDTVFVTQTDTVFQDVIVTDTLVVTEVDTVFQEVIITEEIIITETDTVFQDVIITETDTLFVTEFDTVFVPTDTTFVATSDVLRDVSWTIIENNPPTDSFAVQVDGFTASNSVGFHYRCKDQDTGIYIDTFEHGILNVQDTFTHTFETACSEVLQITVAVNHDEYRTSYKDSIDIGFFRGLDDYDLPLTEGQFRIDFSDVDDTTLTRFTEYWRNNSTINLVNGELVFNVSTQGSQAWVWEDVPEASDMELYIKVRKDLSSTNNLHVKVLTDKNSMTSQEIYLSGNGMLHNWWNNGTWGSGDSAPLVYADGDIVHKVVRVEGTTFYAKAWVDGTPEPDWMIVTEMINRPESGFVSFGAHNPGTRYIQEISVGINGASAPRN